jgi:hypothetical protein
LACHSEYEDVWEHVTEKRDSEVAARVLRSSMFCSGSGLETINVSKIFGTKPKRKIPFLKRDIIKVDFKYVWRECMFVGTGVCGRLV